MADQLSRPTVAGLARSDGLALLRFAYLLCGDRHLAEDLLQEVFAALYRRHPDELPMDNPLAYTRRSLVNLNVSRARRRSTTELPADRLPDRPAADAVTVADRDPLWQALRRLPERQRSVLVLRFYLDWSDDDIAEALGARRGTVRSLASRALVALRADRAITDTTGDLR